MARRWPRWVDGDSLMANPPRGRRIESFSDADVIAHGREARRLRRPIWANPFLRHHAVLWRNAWHRPHDPVNRRIAGSLNRLLPRRKPA